MSTKFGPNGEQVERFIASVQGLEMDDVEAIARAYVNKEIREALRTVRGGHPAARYSALDSAARELVTSTRSILPRATSTAERVVLNNFSELLRAAVFAFASRPKVADAVVAAVVDPITEPLGFEWRSWGVSADG